MSNYIYLSSEDFIRSSANINDQINSKYIQSALREAQDINLQQVLGSNLMTKLQELVSGGTVSADGNEYYKECLDKCQYFLLYHTVAKLCMITSVHISNFGANQPYDENMQNLNLNDTFRVEKYYIDKADHYQLELQNWLIDNHENLPELSCGQCNTISSNLYSAASCGLNLGLARGKGNGRCRKYVGYDKK